VKQYETWKSRPTPYLLHLDNLDRLIQVNKNVLHGARKTRQDYKT